MCWRESGENI
jgi:hypothetical protein